MFFLFLLLLSGVRIAYWFAWDRALLYPKLAVMNQRRSSRLHLPSAGIAGICHHIRLSACSKFVLAFCWLPSTCHSNTYSNQGGNIFWLPIWKMPLPSYQELFPPLYTKQGGMEKVVQMYVHIRQMKRNIIWIVIITDSKYEWLF